MHLGGSGWLGDSEVDVQGSLTRPGAKHTVGVQSAYPKQKRADFFSELLSYAACISKKVPKMQGDEKRHLSDSEGAGLENLYKNRNVFSK